VRSAARAWLKLAVCLCVHVQDVSAVQSTVWSSGLGRLEQLLAQLEAMQEQLTASGGSAEDAAAVASKPAVSLASMAAGVSKSTSECKSALSRDFKSLHSAVTKLGTTVEKVSHTWHIFASKLSKLKQRQQELTFVMSPLLCAPGQAFPADLNDFCKAELCGSPADLAARAAAEQAAADPAVKQSEPVAPFVLPTASQTAPQAANGSAAVAPPAAASTPAAPSHYARSISLVMEESWIRDGRMELVEQLRSEDNAVSAEASSAGALAENGEATVSPVETQKGAPAAGDSYRSVRAMLSALKRRDTEPCLQWLLGEKAVLEARAQHIQQAVAQERQKAHNRGDEETVDGRSGSATAAGPAATRRKRVSFSGADDEKEETAESPFAASSAAALAALSTRMSSVQSSQAALHALHFDLHRLRFLQMLMGRDDSREAEAEGEAQLRAGKHTQQPQQLRTSRKRKSAARSGGDGHASGARSRPVRASLPTSASASASAMEEEEQETAAALAAEQTSSSSSSSASDAEAEGAAETEEDRQLNAVAAAASRKVGIRTPASDAATAAAAPSGVSHHAALKYAQAFFPQFADTRMDGQCPHRMHDDCELVRHLALNPFLVLSLLSFPCQTSVV